MPRAERNSRLGVSPNDRGRASSETSGRSRSASPSGATTLSGVPTRHSTRRNSESGVGSSAAAAIDRRSSRRSSTSVVGTSDGSGSLLRRFSNASHSSQDRGSHGRRTRSTTRTGSHDTGRSMLGPPDTAVVVGGGDQGMNRQRSLREVGLDLRNFTPHIQMTEATIVESDEDLGATMPELAHSNPEVPNAALRGGQGRRFSVDAKMRTPTSSRSRRSTKVSGGSGSASGSSSSRSSSQSSRSGRRRGRSSSSNTTRPRMDASGSGRLGDHSLRGGDLLAASTSASREESIKRVGSAETAPVIPITVRTPIDPKQTSGGARSVARKSLGPSRSNTPPILGGDRGADQALTAPATVVTLDDTTGESPFESGRDMLDDLRNHLAGNGAAVGSATPAPAQKRVRATIPLTMLNMEAVEEGNAAPDGIMSPKPRTARKPSLLSASSAQQYQIQRRGLATSREAGMSAYHGFIPEDDFEGLSWTQTIERVARSRVFLVVVIVATAWALFADDLRLAVLPPAVDGAFSVLNLLCLAIFLAELVVLSVGEPGYLLRFFFWFDVIAALSFLPDLFGVFGYESAFVSQQGLDTGRLVRAHRAVRVVLRISRFARMLKFFSGLSRRRAGGSGFMTGGIGAANDEVAAFAGSHSSGNEPMLRSYDSQASMASVSGASGARTPYRRSRRGSIYQRRASVSNFQEPAAVIHRHGSRVMRLESGNLGSRRLSSSFNGSGGMYGAGHPMVHGGGGSLSMLQSPDASSALGMSMGTIPGPSAAPTGRLHLSSRESKNLRGNLTEMATKKVILGVLLILLVVTFCQVTVDDRGVLYGLLLVEEAAPGEAAAANLSSICNTTSLATMRAFYADLVFVQVGGAACDLGFGLADDVLNEYRVVELHQVETDQGSQAWLDVRTLSRLDALFGLIVTLSILAVLSVAAWLFNRDTQRIVVAPIESITRVLAGLARDPLGHFEDLLKSETHVVETDMLLRMVSKITGLLQIAFGEAGAKIISANVSNRGEVNVMIPGVRIEGIFGFCDIRKFTDVTEVLKEYVMVFVNVVARVVHHITDAHGGHPNKNIGDAFLLVWKVPEAVDGVWTKQQDMADNALDAFMKIVVALQESEEIREVVSRVRQTPGADPRYRLHLGFGLHFGWAIEGAIGSSLKIDASYLSPHVNMAARLESATKMYGVPILVSGDVYAMLSSDRQAFCRKLDRVTVKGSKTPMALYTPDVKSIRDREDYNEAVNQYIDGRWEQARGLIEAFMTRHPNDPPSLFLLRFMHSHEFVPPPDWSGFRRLDEK